MYGYTAIFFHEVFKGRQFTRLPVCYSGVQSLSKMGSALTGMNLLLEEQILSFKSGPHFVHGGKTENGGVTSPESELIHLNKIISL